MPNTRPEAAPTGQRHLSRTVLWFGHQPRDRRNHRDVMKRRHPPLPVILHHHLFEPGEQHTVHRLQARRQRLLP